MYSTHFGLRLTKSIQLLAKICAKNCNCKFSFPVTLTTLDLKFTPLRLSSAMSQLNQKFLRRFPVSITSKARDGRTDGRDATLKRKNACFLNFENVKHVFSNSVRKQQLYANALQFELTEQQKQSTVSLLTSRSVLFFSSIFNFPVLATIIARIQL